LLLTLGLPLVAYAANQAGWQRLALLLPPASVFAAGNGTLTLAWLAGPALAALLSLVLARYALARCDGELRRWYELHHGRKTLD